MNFDILTIFYLIAVFTLLTALGITGSVINQLMGIRIQRPHLLLKDRSELPEYLNAVFENGLKILESLGFEYHHCQYTLDILCHQRNDKWSVVLFNKQTNVYAEISPASSFLDLPGYEIDFWSIANDGSALITLNGRGHTILCGIANAEIHDPMAISFAEAYQSHLNERGDVFGKKPLLSLSNDLYIKVQQKLFDGYFLNLMNERAVVSTGKNQFRLSFSKARRLLPQVLHGQKRLRKLLHEKLVWQETQQNKTATDEPISLSGEPFSVEAEVESYQRMRSVQERTPGGLTAKLLLFALVISLTYFAFNLHFSLYSIVIIIIAFAVHEAGHLITMLMFGFRNYQVLFFPVLIDTSGTETTSPTIWKQVIVYLMGPLPGIIFGLIFLVLSQEYEISWFYEAAILFLVINYLNLLPIAPLDGGHLIRLTIMERFPSGKLILTGMSAIAFAAGGWYLKEPVFWVIAAILVSTLPWSALEAGVLSELFQPTSDFEKLDRKQRLKNLFETFRHDKFSRLQYLQKFNLIKGLSDTLLLPHQLGRLGALGLNLIYFGALILTPPAAIVTMIGMDNTVDMVSQIQGKVPEKNWQTLIENSTDPESKYKAILKAARFYTSTKNFDVAQSFLEQAEKSLALIYSDEFQANLYDAYSFYYLHRQEFEAAEEQQIKVIKLLDQHPRDNSFELAGSYQALAAIHELQNSPSSLIDLKTALSYALNTRLPEERFVISTIVNQLLNKYFASSNTGDAKNILLDTLSVISRHEDSPSRYVAAYLYQELAWINLLTDNLNDSIKQFDRSLQLSNDNSIKAVDISEYGYDPFASVNILLAMAVVQNRAGNFNSANTYLQRAETLLKSDYNETLSSYIDSNVPEALSNSDDMAKKDEEDKNENSDTPERRRKTERWNLIASLVKTNIKNEPSPEKPVLPAATTDLLKEVITDKLTPTPEKTVRDNVQDSKIISDNNNVAAEEAQEISSTAIKSSSLPVKQSAEDSTAGNVVTSPDPAKVEINNVGNQSTAPLPESSPDSVAKKLEIPPLPGEKVEPQQTRSVQTPSLADD